MASGLRFAAALVLIWVPVHGLSAQEGLLTARVVDARTGAPLAGATLRAAAADAPLAGPEVDAQTLDDGTARLTLPAGEWNVAATFIGRHTVRLEGVRITAGQTTDLRSIALEYSPLDVGEVVVSITPGSRGERRIEAPSHVEVVGELDVAGRISASPVDHLRNVAAVDIIQHGVQSANLVVRGFNSIFSGSLHALTDHRLVGVPSLQVNLLHFQPANDLDVQRMEIVLGPGSALYGPNTADGVLHVLTRSPLIDQGTSVSIAGGEKSFQKGAFRAAHLLSENLGIKVSGQYLSAEEWYYEDPVEVANRAAAEADPDAFLAEMQSRGYSRETAELALGQVGRRNFDTRRWGLEARADWRFDDRGTLVLTAGRTGSSGIELTGLGADQIVDFEYSFLQARVSRDRLFAQSYLTMGNAGESYLLRDGLPLIERSWMWVNQAQHGFTIGRAERQRFTYGLDHRRTEPRSDGTVYGIYEDRDGVTEWGGYLQSETALSPRVDLVLSGRADLHSELPDAVLSPRAALVVKPDDNQSLRLTYNRAFSTPTAVNLFLDIPAGRAPEPLGSLGYRLRAQGTGADGFTFVGPGGSLAGMRSPFNPAGADQLLPAEIGVMWPLAVGAAAAIAAAGGEPMDPGLLALLQSLAPDAGDVGISVLDANTGALTPLAATDIDNVPGLRESTTTTWELGYEGVLAGRVRLAADVWHARRRGFISPLVLRAPLLLLDGAGVASFVAGPWIENRARQLVEGGADPDAARAQAEAEAEVAVPAIAGALASVPVGVASAAGVNASGADLLVTHVNVGRVDLWGWDLSATWFLTDRWLVGGALSRVSDDWFEIDDGAPIALNAPKTKGVIRLGFDDGSVRVEGRFRFADGFPAASAELVGTGCVTGDDGGIFEEGCVAPMRLFDLTAGWSVPGTGATAQLSVTDIFNSGYRGFVGVPEMGRFVLLGVRWET